MAEPSQPGAGVPARLQISDEEQGEAKVITLAGELDIASTPMFEQVLSSFGDGAPRRLVIDLSGLAFMDSTGLRALLQARQAAAAADRPLVLRPGPRQVQRVFELSGTLDRFNFED